MAINVRADIEASQKKKKKIDVRADIATTAAPKTSTNKQDKSYTGVDAEINRREASRSARYSMQPEVRAAEIKRAEARGDTKRASELKKATDIEQWTKEQVNSDFVTSRAQTIYDNEFNAAKLRGDQSPAVAAEHAAQGYLDLFRNKPQETRNETYAYRHAENIQEAANVFGSNDFGEMSERGKLIGVNLNGNLPKSRFEKIITFVNNDPYRNSIEALAIMNHGDSNLAKQISQFTEDEKKIIRYYAARGEKDKVEEFYKLMERELNRRLQTTVNKQTRQEAYDKPILGAAKNIVGTMASPAAYIENAGNAVANVFRDDYIPTDYNTPAFRGAHMAEQTSEGVTKRASDAVGGGAAGEVASLIAGTGLSIANQIATLPLGAAGSLAYMTAESAGQTTLDALKSGASAKQALLLGSVSGAIEAITEKIPLDNLFEIAGEIGEKGFKKFIKTLVKNSPKQGITELGEEAISNIANTILDIAVMKEKSGYEQYIAELMKDGMTRPEAEKEALINYVGANTLKAGASGFLSGLVMGGGATAVSKVNTAIESRNAGAAEGEAGFTKNEFSDKISNKTIRALDAIGKKLGTNISIGAPSGTGQGSFNGYYENGRIVISQDADDPLKVVLSHEVTHRMKETAPEEYAKFLEIAVNASEQLSGKQKSEILEDYKTWYSDYTQTDFKYEDALDEITADFAGRLADDLSLFKKLVDTDRNVAQRFIDGVREFILKVKSTFSKDKSKADTASLEKYGLKVSELEEAVKQWDAMAKATETAVKSGNVGIENTAETEPGGERKNSLKRAQLEIIEKNNPAPNTYQTWIRKEEDILTLEEAIADSDWDYDEYNPDYTRAMAKDALEKGEIRVYSSYPIEQGVFVTPSKMEAESYSGNGKVYSKVVPISDVAWIDPTQGQYAVVENTKDAGREKQKNTVGIEADGEKAFRVEYDFGVSQKDIREYIEKSYSKTNDEDFIKYLKANTKLQEDLNDEINISGYAHALRDNDIRHIRNSHGENTNEKYPVTKADIAMIPFIVKNYDKVFYKTNAKGEDGIVYVKVMPDNVVYYVEAVTTQYKKEKLLVNKQMIKTETSEIPNLYGLIDAINKKQNSSQYLADIENIRKAYVQDVKENYSTNSIPETTEKSNPQNLEKKNTDNLGRELSDGQVEYFKDSKVRDKDGNLLVMYRGGNENFTVFDRKKSKYSNLYGRGFYFTDSESHAKQYGNVRAYYLNIKNPVSTTGKTITKEQLRAYLEAVAENEDDYSFENYGYGATVDSVLESVYEGKSDFNMLYDISQTAIGDMVEAVELFNEVNGTDYDGLILDTETVTFKSNQAKNVDNKTPTENPDIRYSFKKPRAEDSTADEVRSESDEEAFRRAFGDWAYDPEEEISYFDETGLADDAAQNPKEDYSNIDALYADYAQRENIIAEEADEREQELIDGAYQNAISDPATEKKTRSEKISESGNFLKRKIVNSGAAIRDIAKVTKDKFLYPIYNRARGAMNIAEDMLTNKQTNIRGEKVGESLESIILPIKNKGKEYFREFHLYLLNKHNVARMSLENAEATARAKAEVDKFLADNPQIARLAALGEDAIQNAAKWDDARGFKAKQYLELRNEWQKLLRTRNKPIFFDKEETPLSADISRTKAEELLKKHPEFAEYEAKVKKYLDNLMQYRVDSGLITQEEADYFRQKYPDYIPTYRNKESVLQELYGKKNIGKTLGIAKGGTEKLLPLDIALAEMTKKVIKNGQKNIFTNKLFEIFEKNSKLLEEYITDVNEGIRELDKQIDEFGEDDPKFKNTVSFYKGGKYIELTMTPKLYEAFAEMSKAPEEKAPVADWWRKINNGYKKLITTYDPTFIIRNGIKDLQDAIINSKDTKALMKNLPKAYVEIANGGELFELYKSMGGLHSSRFDEIKTKGVEKKSWARKLPDALAFGNMMVEQAPRLAEFMSVLEKGDRNDPDVLADALYAAADVTTNFGESGTWGKLLNAYYVPFLNPAIQGTAKVVRTFTEPKTAKQWYGLAAKAVIMGVGAGFINDIIIGIFGDDEEKEAYENLQDRVKDNYFLIPTDDGKFVKIPKGRIAASLGVIADRVRDVAKGEKVSAGEAVARILENIAPENPITNNILSPFITADLFNNESKGRTWYGGDIESDSLQGLPAGERFDSSTDYFSKYAGKALGLSPKKINYILKQYTGGVGRTILPMITPSEQKGNTIAGVIGYGALSILTSNFMTDSKLTNKVSGDFYDAVSEAEQKKNSSKGTLADKVVYKHLNRERNQMSGYNKKIREAETDSSLTSKERDVAVRTATASRSEYQKEVLDNLDKYRANVEKYLKEYPGKDEEKAIDYAYRKANFATYGAEYAIRASGGKSVYDKALEKVKRGKTTWKEYYEEYFGKDERRYKKLREKYDISYAEYEAIAQAMSKNSTEEEEIEALCELGYKRSTARGIRRNYNKVK